MKPMYAGAAEPRKYADRGQIRKAVAPSSTVVTLVVAVPQRGRRGRDLDFPLFLEK